MEHLSPKQVARAIGVSEASLKRWCDRGVIPSIRTAGGHRRITLQSVLAYIQTTQRVAVRPEILGLPSTTGTGQTVQHRAEEQFQTALESGDEEAVQRICFDLSLAGFDAVRLSDRLIAPVFQRIGEGWASGRVEVYQERRACDMCLRAIHRLQAVQKPPRADAAQAIGAAPETDPYTLPTAVCEFVLREAGWRADSLGNNVPLASLIAAARRIRPKLIWLSVSWVRDESEFLRDFERLMTAVSEWGIPVIVGGNRLTASMRHRMASTAYGESAEALQAFARTLPDAPRPAPSGPAGPAGGSGR